VRVYHEELKAFFYPAIFRNLTPVERPVPSGSAGD
jgi:hypothetical protein